MNFKIGAPSIPTDVQLTGAINENCEGALHNLALQLPVGSARFDCEGIDYINSVGVMRWTEFLAALRQRQIAFTFERCAPVFYDYAKIIGIFAPVGTIESLMVPFLCETCDIETLSFVASADLSAAVRDGIVCTVCGGNAEADRDHYD